MDDGQMQADIRALATKVVAAKFSAAGGLPDDFVAEVRALEAGVVDLARKVMAVTGSTSVRGLVAEINAKTKAARAARTPRPSGDGATTGKRPLGITPEALTAALAGGAKKSLQQLADEFVVSKGVAQRAVLGLGSKIRSEEGAKVSGARGRAPTVYFLA